MRIWDLPPMLLCRQHLLGEHRELHGLWNILTQGKAGYGRHPETRRWDGRLAALYLRHEALVAEMRSRGYRHRSPLDRSLATGSGVQDQRIDSLTRQYELLCGKPCPCPVVRWNAEGGASRQEERGKGKEERGKEEVWRRGRQGRGAGAPI